MSTSAEPRTEPRRNGRPPVGPTLAVKLYPHQLDRLGRLAAERGTTRSALVREAVAQAYGAPNHPR